MAAIQSFFRCVSEPQVVPIGAAGETHTIPRLGYGPAYLTPEECDTPYVEVLFMVDTEGRDGYGAIVPREEACPIVRHGMVEDGVMTCIDARGRPHRYHLLYGMGQTAYSFDYSPERLRYLLQGTGTTRVAAATLLGVSKVTVDAWCLPEESKTHRDMPIKKWRRLQAELGGPEAA